MGAIQLRRMRNGCADNQSRRKEQILPEQVIEVNVSFMTERQAQPPRTGVRTTDCDLLKVTLSNI